VRPLIYLSLDEAVMELVRSPKFKMWRKPTKGIEKSSLSLQEKHWTPQELAEIWGVSVQTIREIFQREEGVLKIGKDGTRSRRRYKTLRIPESVAERVHTRLSA
jgi:transcriptional antiterminator